MGEHTGEWVSLTEAAGRFGVNRNTVAGWARAGAKPSAGGKPLRTRRGRVRNLVTTLVNVADLERIVAAGVRPGRPRSAVSQRTN